MPSECRYQSKLLPDSTVPRSCWTLRSKCGAALVPADALERARAVGAWKVSQSLRSSTRRIEQHRCTAALIHTAVQSGDAVRRPVKDQELRCGRRRGSRDPPQLHARALQSRRGSNVMGPPVFGRCMDAKCPHGHRASSLRRRILMIRLLPCWSAGSRLAGRDPV
jgi:hypothetical protein